jgi:hypothetical protein
MKTLLLVILLGSSVAAQTSPRITLSWIQAIDQGNIDSVVRHTLPNAVIDTRVTPFGTTYEQDTVLLGGVPGKLEAELRKDNIDQSKRRSDVTWTSYVMPIEGLLEITEALGINIKKLKNTRGILHTTKGKVLIMLSTAPIDEQTDGWRVTCVAHK